MVDGGGSQFLLFHRVANQKKATGGISSLLINGSIHIDIEIISAYMVSFYTDLFSKDDSVRVNEGFVSSVYLPWLRPRRTPC